MQTEKRTKKTAVALGVVFMIMVSGMAMMWVNDYNQQLRITRVACVGDSITQGSTYTHQLQLMLGYNYSVGNFGLSGSTVAKDSRLPYIYQPQFQRAKNFNPDIVVIMLGTNDANPDVAYNEANFTQDYTDLVSSFLNLDTKPQVVLVESPEIFVSPSSPYNNSYLINNVIPQIDNVADQLNLTKVDMYHAFAEHPDYYMDGVHPNEQGSALIASSMYDAVASVQDDGQT